MSRFLRSGFLRSRFLRSGFLRSRFPASGFLAGRFIGSRFFRTGVLAVVAQIACLAGLLRAVLAGTLLLILLGCAALLRRRGRRLLLRGLVMAFHVGAGFGTLGRLVLLNALLLRLVFFGVGGRL